MTTSPFPGESAPPTEAERRRRVGFVIGLSLMLLALDFASGPFIQFPVLFILPIILCAWWHGGRPAVLLGLLLTAARFWFNWIWGFPLEFAPAVVNTVLRWFLW
jgi:hypothetical protein